MITYPVCKYCDCSVMHGEEYCTGKNCRELDAAAQIGKSRVDPVIKRLSLVVARVLIVIIVCGVTALTVWNMGGAPDTTTDTTVLVARGGK